MPRHKEDRPDDDVSINIVPVGPAMPDVVPTMDTAFHTLCQAMASHLEEDIPARSRLNDVQVWYADGNHVVSWQHAIMLLEHVLGVSLRAT